MEKFVYALSLLSPFLYPSLMSLMGNNEVYEVDEHNTKMIVFIALTGFCAVAYTLNRFRSYFRRVHPFFYFLPLILTVVFLVEDLFMSGAVHDRAYKAFIIFWAYSAPASFIGANLAYKDCLGDVFKYIHLITVFISLGVIVSIPKSLSAGQVVLGGTQYQEISYISAFCAGVLLFTVLFKPNYIFSFFQNKSFRLFEIALLILVALNVFLSGGRGGALLLIVNVILLFFVYIKKNSLISKGVLTFVVGALLVIPIGASIINNNEELSTLFEYGVDRAFSYVSDSGGLDMTQTSNRDIHYKWAIERIRENPFGYGFFRSYGLFVYPHNFFLEILLDGGIAYFTFWLFLILFFFVKLYKLLKNNSNLWCLIPLLSYPVVLLTFSSTYKHNCMFWFCLSYVLSYILKNTHDSLVSDYPPSH